MRLHKYQLAVLAIITANVIWGASIPIFKWALEDIPPFSFAFIRFFLASLLLLPFTMHKLKVNHRDEFKLLLLAFLGFFLHVGLILLGLTLSSSINAPIIASSAPVFLFIGSYIFLKEKIKKSMLLGTGISLLGVIIIILRPVLDEGLDGSIIGNLLFVFSMISFVFYTILIKEFRLPYKTSTITFYMFAFSTIIFFPFFLWESAQQPLLESLTPKGLFGIVFGTIVTLLLAYLLYNYSVKYIKASETGVFLYIDPIITALIAVPLLNEQITPAFLFGSILVFSGIFIAEKRIHYHPLHKLQKKHVPE